MHSHDLSQLIGTSNKVAIIGLGYVGLPLAQLCIENGLHVIGIDIDERKIKQLQISKSYLSDIKDDEIARMMDSNKMMVTSDYSTIRQANHVIICVPTPLDHKKPDLSFIVSAVKSITPYLQKGHLIVLESSTYPGTTEDMIRPMIEKEGWRVGEDLFLGYSPERIDPGNEQIQLKDIPKVVSGVTKHCLERVKHLYSLIFSTIVPVSSPRTAEFVKMLENSQRLINISFMNEVNLLAQKMKVNLWEVIEAAKTKPIGFTPYYPSPGVGGHCIPVDPFFLTWIADQMGVPLSMIQQAGTINDQIPQIIADRVEIELVDREIPLQEAKIGIIGLTYKKDINDIRESASLKVILHLQEKGMNVFTYDPLYTENTSQTDPFYLTRGELEKFDIVLILVDHSKIRWSDVVRFSRLVIDTRNVTKDIKADHIIRL